MFRGLGVGYASQRAVQAFPHGVEEGFMLPHLMRRSSARPFPASVIQRYGRRAGSLFRGLTGDRLLG